MTDDRRLPHDLEDPARHYQPLSSRASWTEARALARAEVRTRDLLSLRNREKRSQVLFRVSELCAATLLAIAILFLAGCTVGPKYARPPAPVAPAYKELTPENFKDTDGWKQAQPGDATLKGNWWEIFNDTQLNALEEQVNVSNQNIAAAAANFLAARALVRQTRAQYYPTISANPTITNSRPSLGQFGGVSGVSTANSNHSPITRWRLTLRGFRISGARFATPSSPMRRLHRPAPRIWRIFV